MDLFFRVISTTVERIRRHRFLRKDPGSWIFLVLQGYEI